MHVLFNYVKRIKTKQVLIVLYSGIQSSKEINLKFDTNHYVLLTVIIFKLVDLLAAHMIRKIILLIIPTYYGLKWYGVCISYNTDKNALPDIYARG